jgi:hypothetical protein
MMNARWTILMVPAFVLALAFGAMAADEEEWFLGQQEGMISLPGHEEMGAASSEPEMGMEEMEPASSEPEVGMEEMDPAGSRGEESSEFEGAPYRVTPEYEGYE